MGVNEEKVVWEVLSGWRKEKEVHGCYFEEAIVRYFLFSGDQQRIQGFVEQIAQWILGEILRLIERLQFGHHSQKKYLPWNHKRIGPRFL